MFEFIMISLVLNWIHYNSRTIILILLFLPLSNSKFVGSHQHTYHFFIGYDEIPKRLNSLNLV